MVDRITGNLKIGDLISIEKVNDNGYFSKYIGTEEFMAPEVKEGKYTFKADIYSLGITIIQILTMERPYKEFRKKENLYEAKKKGLFPLSFQPHGLIHPRGIRLCRVLWTWCRLRAIQVRTDYVRSRTPILCPSARGS